MSIDFYFLRKNRGEGNSCEWETAQFLWMTELMWGSFLSGWAGSMYAWPKHGFCIRPNGVQYGYLWGSHVTPSLYFSIILSYDLLLTGESKCLQIHRSRLLQLAPKAFFLQFLKPFVICKIYVSRPINSRKTSCL